MGWSKDSGTERGHDGFGTQGHQTTGQDTQNQDQGAIEGQDHANITASRHGGRRDRCIKVHDFDELRKIFDSEFATRDFDYNELEHYGVELHSKLGLKIVTDNPEFSDFFKSNMMPRVNKGIMVREGL